MKPQLRKNYNEGNDIFGYPQDYKGIKLYPIKIKDLQYQNLFYQIFCHPKNYIPDRDILRSSYLKFAIYVIGNGMSDLETWIREFQDMMKYITKQEVELISTRGIGEGLDSVALGIKIGENKFSEQEFDEMREIILEQQGTSVEYIEEYDPSLEKHLAFMRRGSSDIDFADEVFTFCTIMKLGLREVEDYTVYQFKSMLERLLALKEYDLYQPLLVSGQITLKSGEIKHYFYHNKKESRYSSILVDYDEFMGKNAEIFKE